MRWLGAGVFTSGVYFLMTLCWVDYGIEKARYAELRKIQLEALKVSVLVDEFRRDLRIQAYQLRHECLSREPLKVKYTPHVTTL